MRNVRDGNETKNESTPEGARMAPGKFLPDPPLPSAKIGYRQEERFAENGLRRAIRPIGGSVTGNTL